MYKRQIPDFSPRQGYLYAAPLGLDAPAAWWLPGGDGDGARIVDVEVAWTEEHVDFDPDLLFFDGGAPQDGLPLYSDHGTADLGIVIAKHDGRGIDGLAPRASWGVEALAPAEHPFAADRLLEAATQLRPGDLLLVELQMFPDGRGATPIEWLQANYDAIETIVYGLGIAVVEAAGNGGQDLDDPSWEGLFDRHIRDSGAILVAAGKPADLTAESFTNHGSRVDLHGWGSQIVTTGFGDLHGLGSPEIEYTATFNGTSGAAAMVSGAALCAASAYRAWRGAPLDPIRLRAILRGTGTPHAGPLPIGPRPNLAAAIPATLDPSLLPADSLPAPPVARLLASPNPFRSGLTIRFWLARDAGVDLRVLDSSGRRIAQPFHGPLRAGPRTLAWDGRDDAGREAASGLYLLRVETDAGIPPPAARAVKIR
ncbi:MAG: S8 family serine peptidase [Candidatus Eisenbacteria bacterium]|nr:S8 family serine peptidase [Candidatus Eisenbacteria bacterium]